MAAKWNSTKLGWQEEILGLDMAKKWKLHIEIRGSMDQIREDIGMGQALAVSDALYQHESRAESRNHW